MGSLAALSARGDSESRNWPGGAWARILLIPAAILACWPCAAWTAAGDSTGILPKALVKPSWCNFASAHDLNGGAYMDGLIVVGSVACPTDTAVSVSLPYLWRDGSWSALELPEGSYEEGFAESVSEDVTAPLTVTYHLFDNGDSGGGNPAWQTWVLTDGQPPVRLAPLEGMTFISNAVLSGQGDHIVGGNRSGDWETGFTYRAVRWSRDGDGWSLPEDLAEGLAISTTADGGTVVGNGDGEARGTTGGNAWVWVAASAGGGEVTQLGADARVYDITHDGSMIVGSRPEPCTNGDCYFPVPVYWVVQDGEWTVHELQALDGVDSSALAVADVQGQTIIVGEGWSNVQGGISRAVVWMPQPGGGYGPAQRLEAIGGNFESWSWPVDINRSGYVLGWSEFEPWGAGSDVLWSLFGTFPFAINGGLGDAWYDPAADGQGFFISVWEDIQMMFVGWFTYGDDGAGESKHYWMTAQGSYTEDRAELGITVSEGGAFVAGAPAPMRHSDGTMTVEFHNCLEGTVSFDIPSMGRQGSVPIQRIARDNVTGCEKQAAGVE